MTEDEQDTLAVAIGVTLTPAALLARGNMSRTDWLDVCGAAYDAAGALGPAWISGLKEEHDEKK